MAADGSCWSVELVGGAVGDDSAVPDATAGRGRALGPQRGVRVVDGLITGWHEPEASHLHMLEAIAGHRCWRPATTPRSRTATCGTSSATPT